jgi:hypothetical protein
MNAVILSVANMENAKYYWTLLMSFPFLIIAMWNMWQKNQVATH